MVKKNADYKPFYPTTVGTKSHDITLQQLPAYSIRPKPEIKEKWYSPGPGAYPKDEVKRGHHIPKSIYPADKAYQYSIGLKGKEVKKFATPSPATYPIEKNREKKDKNETLSIYPKDNGNKFSIGVRREQKNIPLSPGPAVFPRDTDTSKNINTLFTEGKANKFTIPPRPSQKKPTMSPGPAQYPCVKKASKNKIVSIYPTETQLLPTMKLRYEYTNKHRIPAPNAYPLLDDDAKKPKPDLTRKMIMGKRSPLYSIGIKHSPKQHILILKDDEY